MIEDPIKRYVDVLKDRVTILEKECAAANEKMDDMEKIIAAYEKITNLTIFINENETND